uniref:hypothetical protein n=1 Tax=Ningiella ruwaisensis TaxID=2364274 RepID=UPI0010A08009|nr:hypothetical protein [Ningiella ruwaisensis]
MLKTLVKVVLVGSFASLSLYANAAFIGADDIDSISVQTPEGWTAVNEDALFDGITRKRKSTRFIGYRNDGDALSAANPLQIIANLTAPTNVVGFSFFNDWGYHLDQQVMDLAVRFDGHDGTRRYAVTYEYFGLDVNTWDEIFLFSDVLFAGVNKITVDVRGVNKVNFEIRELKFATMPDIALSTSNLVSGTANVNAPAIASLLGLALFATIRLRRK